MVWVRKRAFFNNRTELLVGCGRAGHANIPLQCDTLDIDDEMDADISGDILCRDIQKEYHGKYKVIFLEGVFPEVIADPYLYNNLSILTQARALIIIYCMTPKLISLINRQATLKGWSVEIVSDLENLPQTLSIDDDFLKLYRPQHQFSAMKFALINKN